MSMVLVKHHGDTLVRELSEEATKCRHCGADPYKVGRKLRNRRKPMYSYDDTMIAFCNRECFASFWDALLRQHGVHFQRFIYRLVCSGEVPDEMLGDELYLAALWDSAVELAIQFASAA